LNEDGSINEIYDLVYFKSYKSEGRIISCSAFNCKHEDFLVRNKKGHWISKVVTDNGEVASIYERTIEYYK